MDLSPYLRLYPRLLSAATTVSRGSCRPLLLAPRVALWSAVVASNLLTLKIDGRGIPVRPIWESVIFICVIVNAPALLLKRRNLSDLVDLLQEPFYGFEVILVSVVFFVILVI